jgi:hypothetical protein
MRQFPYAPRTHPSSAQRGDAPQQQQQQQQQSQPQRDTMSDMQEQFSKLAESTSRLLPSQSALGDSILHPILASRLFGIRLAAFAFAQRLLRSLIPYCSWQTHVQLPRVQGESQSPRFRPAEVRGIFRLLLPLPVPSPSHLRRATGKGRRWGRGNITSAHALNRSLIRQRLTGTPQTHHHLAQALASAPAMLPNRPHLEWIDTRSKHITRRGSLQTRSQDQLMMISRVSSAF